MLSLSKRRAAFFLSFKKTENGSVKNLLVGIAIGALATACGNSAEETTAEIDEATQADDVAMDGGATEVESEETAIASAMSLDEVLDSRSDELKARYQYRHPKETLEFFGVEPGMVIGEAGPGAAWYTQILAPLIGSSGAIYAINYADDMWQHFGIFDEQQIADRVAASAGFKDQVAAIDGAENVRADGFPLNSVPQELYGTLDMVLSIRFLHNTANFEEEGGYRTNALQEFNNLLKPGGILGVVQHRASADMSDEFADGSMGYLKQDALIATIESAGFKLVDTSEINANPNDQPSADEYVWRLPPTLFHQTDEMKAKKDEYLAIGESDRMTLKFVKE